MIMTSIIMMIMIIIIIVMIITIITVIIMIIVITTIIIMMIVIMIRAFFLKRDFRNWVLVRPHPLRPRCGPPALWWISPCKGWKHRSLESLGPPHPTHMIDYNMIQYAII